MVRAYMGGGWSAGFISAGGSGVRVMCLGSNLMYNCTCLIIYYWMKCVCVQNYLNFCFQKFKIVGDCLILWERLVFVAMPWG